VRVEVVEDINDIDEAAWDAMTSSGAYYASRDWIRRHNTLFHPKTVYICVRDGSRLLAVAPFSFARREPSYEHSQRRLADVFGEDSTFAILGSRRGYRNKWLTHPEAGGVELKDIVGHMVAAALDLARSWNVDAVVAPYLTAAATKLLAGQAGVSRIQEFSTEAVLDLPGGSFDDYIAGLGRQSRSNVRRERAQPLALGLQLQREPIRPGIADMLAGPMAQVEAKYGREFSVGGLRRYLVETLEDNAANARLFTCRSSSGDLICATMAFEWKSALYIRSTATDYAADPPKSFAHFNTVYYEPIEYCLRTGLRRIYFGTETLKTKVARGCRTSPLYHVLLKS